MRMLLLNQANYLNIVHLNQSSTILMFTTQKNGNGFVEFGLRQG